MSGAAKDVYLDQVQAAVEAHPTWDADDILRHVFERWGGHNIEAFVLGVKDDMRKAELAPRRNAFEVRP